MLTSASCGDDLPSEERFEATEQSLAEVHQVASWKSSTCRRAIVEEVETLRIQIG
jgi:hypothetical protein